MPEQLSIDRQSDELLWNALKQGDQQAFGALYQRYHRILYSYGYKIIPNAAPVEDAIQDLFIDIWRMRHSLSLVDSVKFYLFRSLRRKIFHLSEREKRIDTAIAFSTVLEFAQSSEQVIADQEQEDQLTQRLTQLVAQLPQRQLEVVTLRFYQNFKTDEIAAIMGITEKSVRNTLHKALTHLREQAAYLAPLLGLFLLWVLA